MRDPERITEALILGQVEDILRADGGELRSRQVKALIKALAERLDNLYDRVTRLENRP